MEEIKEKTSGRGGRREGAGRPFKRDNQKAITKSITLTQEEWDLFALHSRSGSFSKAVQAALDLALDSRSRPPDWIPNK